MTSPVAPGAAPAAAKQVQAKAAAKRAARQALQARRQAVPRGFRAGVGAPVRPPQTHRSSPSSLSFINPERGFYSAVDMLSGDDLSWVRDQGRSLVFSYVRLDDYRTSSLPSALLGEMQAGFDTVRAARLKLILRFAYNFGPYPNSEPDASKSQIQAHLAQVAPVLAQNTDVLLLLQAGFIGAWGEWHTSTNQLLEDPQDRADILASLLAALPASRMTQLRYPAYKAELYGEPITEAQAFSGAAAARVGHHNDCFLASDTDQGTYDTRGDIPARSPSEWKAFVAADTHYLPMGGETCQVSSRSGCDTAMAEMEQLHFSYINEDYHPDVVDSWAPCRDTIERRIGYRFQLTTGELPSAVLPGGSFQIKLNVENQGYASLFNPRQVVVHLVGAGGARFSAGVNLDPRRWAPGATSLVEARFALPASLPPGTYSLELGLPDAAESLQAYPEYAVRFANTGWQAASGTTLLTQLEVRADAPGTSDPTRTAFEQIP